MLPKILAFSLVLFTLSCRFVAGTSASTHASAEQPWSWQKIADFGGPPTRGAHVFTADGAAYVVSGAGDDSVPHHQVWKYDPAANAWIRKNDYPGTAIIEGVAFSIGEAGYVGLGSTNGHGDPTTELWHYSAQADRWMRRASFPGSARSGLVALVIGAKAYVVGGASGKPLRDVWEFDPQSNRWTRKADFPGAGRFMPAGFVIGTRGYLGLGSPGVGAFARDFWEYDPLDDRWARKRDFPGAPRAYAIGLSLGSRGYVGVGMVGFDRFSGALNLTREVWEYDPAADTWARKRDFAGQSRSMAVGFALGSDIYFGLGNDAAIRNLKDFRRAGVSVAGQ